MTGNGGAGALPMATLTKRADFLRAASARRQTAPAFLLQARRRGDAEPAAALVRIGFTCSKKVGNAVARNRAKRRLREIARAVLPAAARPGWDYVLVGRPGATATRDFALLLDDLGRAMAQIHSDRPRHDGSRANGSRPNGSRHDRSAAPK